MTPLLRKLGHLLNRHARVRQLEEEMRTHVDLIIEENIRRGHSREEARRLAQVAFGNVLATREETVDSLGWPRLESWGQDLRLAMRSLVRRPAFALSLVLILTLGIGATTSIYTLVRGVLWQPLPVPHPAELQLAVEGAGRPFLFSAPTAARLAETPELRGRVIAYSSPAGASVRLGDTPAESISLQFVRGDFFTALQLAPWRGRMLNLTDDETGRPRPVVVISYLWWQRKLGGDPAAIGRAIRVNGRELTVVGIAPAAFTGVSVGNGVDAWLPLGLHVPLNVDASAMIVSRDESPTRAQWLGSELVAWQNIMLRLPPGMSSAQGLLDAAWRPQITAMQEVFDTPEDRADFGRRTPRLVPSPQGFSSTRDNFRRAGLTLLLLVGAVVLVTAANSSTLLLLRMLGRSREMGVRLALGAGRWRLARGALMEGFLLSVAGAACGLLTGLWLTPLLAGWLVPSAADSLPGTDLPLLGFLGGLTILLGLLLGAAPAWLMSRLSPQSILQQRSGGGRGSMRLGRALIVLQLVLSVLLVAVAGSLALDLHRVLNADLGYARDSAITTFFDLRAAGFSREQQPAVVERLRQAALSLPQVRAVGFASNGVLSGSQSTSRIFFRGEGVQQPAESTQQEGVDENYFNAMGLRLVRGRGFTAIPAGTKSPRTVVISQQLAKQVFGDADPIGRRFGFDKNVSPEDWEVIGVVGDARVNGVREEPVAIFYTPLVTSRHDVGCLVVRVDGNAAGIVEPLRRKVAGAEPSLLFNKWLTLGERAQRWMRNDFATVRLTAGFGALATLLAVIGVLGALGYLVASRSREIAVRLAVGAEPKRIWREIVSDALKLGALGAGLGLVLAALLPRVLGAWMMTGLRTEWVAIGGAAGVGLAAALLGGLLPARRASKVDPLTLLRSE